MKATAYMVSVQWGTNLHYFVGGSDSYEECEKLAFETSTKVRRKWLLKRGPARPEVMIWEMRDIRAPC